MIFDLKFLGECFDVDFSTGALFWKESRPIEHFPTIKGYKSWTTKSASTSPVTKDGNGYLSVGVTYKGKYLTYSQHRVIYALYHNDPNPPLVDHFNRDITDNRPSNLRPSTVAGNAKNRKKSKSNTSGITGIDFILRESGYYFWLTKSTKPEGPKDITFRDFFLACCERKSWELKNGYTESHGKY